MTVLLKLSIGDPIWPEDLVDSLEILLTHICNLDTTTASKQREYWSLKVIEILFELQLLVKLAKAVQDLLILALTHVKVHPA